MTIKLIATDMDGTLLNHDNAVSQRNREAIRAARAAGVRVVLCTGRPLPGIATYLEPLGLTTDDDYAIAYNGALVQSCASGTVLLQHEVTLADYARFYTLSQRFHVDIHAEDNQTLYAGQSPTSALTRTEARLTFINLVVRTPDDFAPDTRFAKIMFIDQPAQIDRLQAHLAPATRAAYTIVRSEPYFLEVLNQRASKGRALAGLAAKLHVQPDEVMVLGDQANDLSMFNYAGWGVAMGNAIPASKPRPMP
ncbi:Cof-type HAD-IIB family hydrolase [Lacticaseibacillus thailandensis]|uniref:Cof-type HAD-IIB family hydrolase n=1 Tax=Lacticaseibacillus thailandensis TaxID=381741 RepID=UPI0006D18BDA|nr:Cof-type HAD-IIB family hydrolase [Lacticaseibacillus thailandensis]